MSIGNRIKRVAREAAQAPAADTAGMEVRRGILR